MLIRLIPPWKRLSFRQAEPLDLAENLWFTCTKAEMENCKHIHRCTRYANTTGLWKRKMMWKQSFSCLSLFYFPPRTYHQHRFRRRLQFESSLTKLIPDLQFGARGRKEGMQSKLGSGMRRSLQQATPEVDRNSIRLELLTRVAVRNCSRGFHPPRPRLQPTPLPAHRRTNIALTTKKIYKNERR